MAVLRFDSDLGEGADMSDFEFSYGWVSSRSKSTLRITDGEFTSTLRGEFRYASDGLHGTLDALTLSWYGDRVYSATGLDKNAYTYWRLSQADDAEGTFRYLASGDDTVIGTRFSDLLRGASGDDVLRGSSGGDRLYGERGRDVLLGGGGHDILHGGSSADVFAFAAAAESPKGGARDLIGDFSRAQGDKIDLSDLDANENRRGVQDFDYIGSDAWSGRAGEMRFQGGILAGDTDGDRNADFAVSVAGEAWVRESDLIL